MTCDIEDIKKAAAILQNGGIVAFPTETVYGLGADATNPTAVARIFQAKERPSFDPLIVHIAEKSQVDEIVSDIPASAQKLMNKFWPGPLTLILPKKKTIPDIVTSGLQGVGIRMPDNANARKLISICGKPIAAPSANKFGSISPTCANHVKEQLGNRVDMILDGGSCRVGVESTIISFIDKTPVLLRAGGLPLEIAEEEIGKIIIPDTSEYKNVSPGRSLRHYAPLTPLRFETVIPPFEDGKRVGFIGLKRPANPDKFYKLEIISESGDLNEAACNLFSALRRLDALKLDLIIAIKVPDTGLGRAINDRLFRAANNRGSI